MTGHKFKIGEKVELARDPLNRTTGIYEVTALLPEELQGWQYRIQDPQSKQQRVVFESRLSEVDSR